MYAESAGYRCKQISLSKGIYAMSEKHITAEHQQHQKDQYQQCKRDVQEII